MLSPRQRGSTRMNGPAGASARFSADCSLRKSAGRDVKRVDGRTPGSSYRNGMRRTAADTRTRARRISPARIHVDPVAESGHQPVDCDRRTRERIAGRAEVSHKNRQRSRFRHRIPPRLEPDASLRNFKVAASNLDGARVKPEAHAKRARVSKRWGLPKPSNGDLGPRSHRGGCSIARNAVPTRESGKRCG